ncbi:MAG: CHAD domain-containing protein [Armatimonadetes bacterium]|nr:CHAD domain-containing protein [Armatimonadota bacterium]
MAKSAYDIAADATYAQAAHTAIRHQLHEMMDNLPGTRAGDDIEALHDMRVASRRLRAALSVFAAAFPPKPFRALEKRVARITDALGVVRDADVLIEFVTQARDAASESERVGVDAFLEHLTNQREQDRVALVKALNKLENSSFLKDFDALLDQGEGGAHG